MIPFIPYAVLGAAIFAIITYVVGHHNGWAERDQQHKIEN